jgi:hypothetical protein
MRAREFIIERSFSKRKSDVLSATFAFPTMPSSNPYAAYRFSMAMADHTINYPEGPTSNYAVVTAYAPEEEEIIRAGTKQTGHKGKLVADKESHEPDSTGKVSALPKFKKNKYGV